MGIKTLMEMTPKAMEKRKNIKAMTQKFNAEMGSIESVKTGLMDYRFKFWGEKNSELIHCFLPFLVLSLVWSPDHLVLAADFF